jgi:microcystin degradation protein MlrC
MMHKIAFIEIHQETNSFSEVPTTLQDFKNFIYREGNDIFTLLPEYKKIQGYGCKKAIEKLNEGDLQLIPIISTWANSGGLVTADCFQYFKDVTTKAVNENPDISGVYLSLHGAMGVECIEDSEGDFLNFLREILPKKTIIGLSLDLHACVTKKMVHLADFIVGYQTNPHRDHFRTGYKTTEILIRAVRGEIKPTMAFQQLSLLKGGGLGIDFLQPMRKIFALMKKMQRKKEILSVSTFMSHIWLDDAELGWSTIAVTNENPILAEELSIKLADECWAVREIKHPKPISPEEAILKVRAATWKRKLGVCVLCDTADAVSAGAPGENTHILKSIYENATDLRIYLPIRDAKVVFDLEETPVGASVKVNIGKKLEKKYNHDFEFSGEIFSKTTLPNLGKVLVLKRNELYLIVSEFPNPVWYPAFFKDVGLSLWKADAIVVKNLFPFRLHFWKYNRLTLNVITAGTTNLNVFDLEYRKITSPIYPLDDVKTWKREMKK